ncbi:hypothetical protein [Pseudoalteromonas luteoviolacea]|uniref:Uncharacterized protein n=1 Tax=Pseudoalteromonas luteoviolacea NCIMB 1942 TaxID=1365253 RepID=A0A167BWY5_9GAMM|nr:hypothetical protein [Pseudoalteromonas luteoviolacea]KZN46992.1 hypothetical protein N482_01905 [Pseudoalteromonas luteoviolacea NCIMB 1942]KZW99226.1 hypothetical protein JL49_18475 [Pseudoalteromonas luteoviolacea]
MITQILGSLIFLPFIFFYSYVLGPALKVALLPGGLALLFLILGPKAFKQHWKAAYSETKHEEPTEQGEVA